MTYRTLQSLRQNEDGATLVEFAMIAPVFLLMLIGMFDISHTLYTQAILQGTMQKAGRDSSLEGASGNQAAIEASVTSQVKKLVPSSTIEFERKAYFDFSDIGQQELWDDDDGNGICDNGEPFEDANDNGQWDADRGQDGFGGARDAILPPVGIPQGAGWLRRRP